MTQDSIGVDISKDHLDAACNAPARQARFTNDAAGLRALRRWIGPATAAARIVYEPTGRFHRGFEQALAGWPLVKVNPLQARRFAQACGTRARTDAVDARMLARMGAQLDLPPDAPISEAMRELRDLQVARAGLVRARLAALQRQGQARLPLLRRLAARLVREIEPQLAETEAEIEARIAADDALAERRRILVSVPGLGPRAAAALVVEMPELGGISAKEAAALAGLAPMTRQSGRWSGKARISGGRRSLRQALYMPALSAIRCNPRMRRTYQRLVAAGKPPKLAITAFVGQTVPRTVGRSSSLRKLVVLANTLLAERRQWRRQPA